MLKCNFDSDVFNSVKSKREKGKEKKRKSTLLKENKCLQSDFNVNPIEFHVLIQVGESKQASEWASGKEKYTNSRALQEMRILHFLLLSLSLVTLVMTKC
jgi:hypothetical protein